jgi:hypothetical protein
MTILLILAIIVGGSVVLIEESLRRAPEAVEDERGFHVIGESATKEQVAQGRSDEGADAAVHPSFLGAVHSK